jgi:hypothetical protein
MSKILLSPSNRCLPNQSSLSRIDNMGGMRAAPESFESMNEGPTLLAKLRDTECDASSSVSAISIPPALRRSNQMSCTAADKTEATHLSPKLLDADPSDPVAPMQCWAAARLACLTLSMEA